MHLNKRFTSQLQVAHTYNPSYSGARDQEDHSLKPAGANSSGNTISKITITKKGWWSGLRCKSRVKAPVPQRKKNHQHTG
jgi:hypothetical protein